MGRADDGDEPVRLGPGDVMVARGPEPYTVADQPDSEPQIFINPGQHCTDAEGNSLEDLMDLGTRSWGNDPAGETMIVTGTYESTRAISARLLRSLPQLFVLRDGEWNGELVTVLCAEMQRDELGQEVFLDRLLDLVVIAAVRDWFGRRRLTRAGLAPRPPIPSSARRCDCSRTTSPGPGPWRPWRPRSASPELRWPAASRRSSANRRCPISRPCDSTWPPTCCASPT